MNEFNETVVAPGIVTNPARRRGKPTLAGTRITVEEVFDKLVAGRSIEDILEAWPHLTRERVLNAIAYAAGLVREQAPASQSSVLEEDDALFRPLP